MNLQPVITLKGKCANINVSEMESKLNEAFKTKGKLIDVSSDGLLKLQYDAPSFKGLMFTRCLGEIGNLFDLTDFLNRDVSVDWVSIKEE